MSSLSTLKLKQDENSVAAKSLRCERTLIQVVPNRTSRVDQFFARLAPAVADMALIFFNAISVFYLWSVWQFKERPHVGVLAHSVGPYFAFLLTYAMLIILLLKAVELYKPGKAFSAVQEALLIAGAVGVTTLLLIGMSGGTGLMTLNWTIMSAVGILSALTLLGWRICERSYRRRRIRRGNGIRNVVIVGADTNGQVLAGYLDANPHLGYVVRGFVDPDSHTDPRLLGKVQDLDKIVSRHFIDDVFVVDTSEETVLHEIMQEASRQRFEVKVVPQCVTGGNTPIKWGHVGNLAALVLHEAHVPGFRVLAKRTLDILLAAIGLLMGLPLMVLVACAIKLDSSGPVIYRSWRVGKKGTQFVCYKFRTMVDNAHTLKEHYLHMNERDGPLFKISGDPRLTRLGGFLRKYSLDELPQLWNVLRGDMSMVGPRPALPEELEHYLLPHMRRLGATPGLTGLWQVSARQDPSFDTYMSLDLYYVANWSLSLDVKILLRTIPAVLRAEGR